jgi:copper chaperone CopZ
MTTTLFATVGQKFTVAGMTCHHCEMAITAELRTVPGVTRVVVDVAGGTVCTESVAPLERDTVAAALGDAGYELV